MQPAFCRFGLKTTAHPVATHRFYASREGMDERQIEAALDSLEKALARAETALDKHRTANSAVRAEAAARNEQLAALESRHVELKKAVAQGLHQLDDILSQLETAPADNTVNGKDAAI